MKNQALGTTSPILHKAIPLGVEDLLLFQHTEEGRDLNQIPRWRALTQMKEEDKVMARDLNKTGVSNMPDEEFKAIIIRILTGPEKRIEYIRETLTTEIKELKKESEIKNVINEIGNRLDAMNSRLDEVEE